MNQLETKKVLFCVALILKQDTELQTLYLELQSLSPIKFIVIHFAVVYSFELAFMPLTVHLRTANIRFFQETKMLLSFFEFQYRTFKESLVALSLN